MLVLGVDPGNVTGIVEIHIEGEDIVEIASQQLAINDTFEWLMNELPSLGADLIGIERFIIGTKAAQVTRQLDALYVIGATMAVARVNRIPLRLNSSADAKRSWNNERLGKLDVSVPGKHATDALRHALLAAQQRGTVVV